MQCILDQASPDFHTDWVVPLTPCHTQSHSLLTITRIRNSSACNPLTHTILTYILRL